ncbi:MAG TPA: ATP-binding protein [Chthoniobacteraceae bacterium]|jgi:two-component system NtrC family sensor kinase|nr:ATP-binding protein [Chthoniobacteraceae bacterium]
MIFTPDSDTNGRTRIERLEIASQVEHAACVPASMPLDAVYEEFRTHSHEFAGVVEDRRLIGVVSRGHVGFLLGARYGFSIYGRKPVGAHTMPHPLIIRRDIPMIGLLEAALGRDGDAFHDDVGIVEENGDFLGLISVRTLVRLQSRLVEEKRLIEEEQHAALAEKNRQLFRSLNELRQSQGRFEILFENSALGVALLDHRGNVETCNRRLYELLALKAPARPGEGGLLNLAELVPAARREDFLRALRERERHGAGECGRPEEITVQVEDRPRLFRIFFNWIKETGQICALLDDVTGQRAMERRLAQEEKSALLDSLVGGIAHEINNKLSPIIGFSELLMAQAAASGSDNGDLEQFSSIIRQSATESARIISQLLQLSRPSSATERAVCDLGAVVDDSLAILKLRLRSIGSRLEWTQPDVPMPVLADVSQMKQVLINLVINAVDAMEKCPVRELKITIERAGENICLAISDSGHGIRPEHLGRVFDPFFTTKGPHRGTGLGLSVCFSLVRQHGGDLQVESTAGVGTRFRITLPASEEPMPEAGETGVIRLEPHVLRPSDNPAQALVVDDESYITGLVQEALRVRMGVIVRRVSRSRDAMEFLKTGNYDLVISDIRMPDFDGFEFYAWLCANCPHLRERFLFITGDAGSKELNAKLEGLNVPFLRKPFLVDDLLLSCRRIFDKTLSAAV